MLGINGWPTCRVETIWAEGAEAPGQGALIQELVKACRRRGVSLYLKLMHWRALVFSACGRKTKRPLCGRSLFDPTAPSAWSKPAIFLCLNPLRRERRTL